MLFEPQTSCDRVVFSICHGKKKCPIACYQFWIVNSSSNNFVKAFDKFSLNFCPVTTSNVGLRGARELACAGETHCCLAIFELIYNHSLPVKVEAILTTQARTKHLHRRHKLHIACRKLKRNSYRLMNYSQLSEATTIF